MNIEQLLVPLLLAYIAVQVTYTSAKLRGTTSSHATRIRVFVDTSVLMDGRVVQVARTGFLPGTLVVPRSVVAELQFLADNSDSERRERARKGLDVISELQAMDAVDVEILQDGKAMSGVDDRLLELTKKYNGVLCTIDFNLNKVAQVEGLRVLNVNELAKNLRMMYSPGDTLNITLAQKGQDGHQAIGHLTDGTMVVVEYAAAYIGKTVEIEVIRSLQTDAGRMLFAKRVASDRDKKELVKKKVAALPKAVTPKQKSSGRRPAAQHTTSESPREPVRTPQHIQPSTRVVRPKNTQPSPSTSSNSQRPDAVSSAPRPVSKNTRNSRTHRRAPSPEDSFVSLANK